MVWIEEMEREKIAIEKRKEDAGGGWRCVRGVSKSDGIRSRVTYNFNFFLN